MYINEEVTNPHIRAIYSLNSNLMTCVICPAFKQYRNVHSTLERTSQIQVTKKFRKTHKNHGTKINVIFETRN